MRHCAVAWLLVTIAVLSIPRESLAQKSGAASKTTPDFGGIWESATLGGPGGFIVTQQPSMQPWAEEVFKKLRQGTQTSTERTLNEADPILAPYCMPHGFPRVFTHTPPFEIVQIPGRLYMLFEANNQVRRIYLDGRKHPEGAPPTFFGHSTGKWDGDTLVVETVGLEGLGGYARIDALGHVHSDALRVEERIRRVDHDTLTIDFLFDDAKAYAKPWSGKKVFKLRPDWEMMDYNICQDEQKELYLKDVGGAKDGE